jgi:hypothetical protein
MSGYRNKYLEMLKTDFGKKPLPYELPKLPKPSFDGFVSSQERPFSEFLPPLDAEGVPCGGCPSCGQGEFWRWPKFHPDHVPTGWICWFCSPPPHGSGPCDFCGVPDYMVNVSSHGTLSSSLADESLKPARGRRR